MVCHFTSLSSAEFTNKFTANLVPKLISRTSSLRPWNEPGYEIGLQHFEEYMHKKLLSVFGESNNAFLKQRYHNSHQLHKIQFLLNVVFKLFNYIWQQNTF